MKGETIACHCLIPLPKQTTPGLCSQLTIYSRLGACAVRKMSYFEAGRTDMKAKLPSPALTRRLLQSWCLLKLLKGPELEQILNNVKAFIEMY